VPDLTAPDQRDRHVPRGVLCASVASHFASSVPLAPFRHPHDRYALRPAAPTRPRLHGHERPTVRRRGPPTGLYGDRAIVGRAAVSRAGALCGSRPSVPPGLQTSFSCRQHVKTPRYFRLACRLSRHSSLPSLPGRTTWPPARRLTCASALVARSHSARPVRSVSAPPPRAGPPFALRFVCAGFFARSPAPVCLAALFRSVGFGVPAVVPSASLPHRAPLSPWPGPFVSSAPHEMPGCPTPPRPPLWAWGPAASRGTFCFQAAVSLALRAVRARGKSRLGRRLWAGLASEQNLGTVRCCLRFFRPFFCCWSALVPFCRLARGRGAVGVTEQLTPARGSRRPLSQPPDSLHPFVVCYA